MKLLMRRSRRQGERQRQKEEEKKVRALEIQREREGGRESNQLYSHAHTAVNTCHGKRKCGG